MKRPFAITGVAILILMLCFIYFESMALVWCALVLSAIGLILTFTLKIKDKEPLLSRMLCGAVAVSAVLFMFYEYSREVTLDLTGNDVAVEAVITEKPQLSEEKGRYYFVASLRSMSGKRAYGRIRLSFADADKSIVAADLNIGDRISFNATTYKIGTDNADIHKYYNSLGIYTSGYSIRNLTVENPSFRPVSYYFSMLRNELLSKIRMGFTSEVAGVIIAILTGDKSYTSEEIYSDFKTSGVAHFMAVSGMHLSIWILFLSIISEKLKIKRYLSIGLLVLAVIFVVFLSSFTPSVMRAGIMSLIYLLGKALNQNSDGMNSLGISAIILVFLNPYIVLNVGFQLSFISVAAIFILAMPVADIFTQKVESLKLHAIIKRVISTCITSVCISLSVTLFTYPVSVMAFGGISAVSPVTNLVLFFSTVTILVLTLVYLIFSALPFMATLISFFLDLSVSQTINITQIMSSFSFSYFKADVDSFGLWFLIFAAVMTVLYFILRKKGHLLRFTVMGIVVAVVFSGFIAVRGNLGQFKITVLETGEKCSCLVTMNDKSVLVGLGESYYFEDNLSDVLEEFGTVLEAVVMPGDADSERLDYITSKYGIDMIADSRGEEVELFGRVRIENMGSYAKVSGNSNRVSIFFDRYLEKLRNYDIIFDESGFYLPDSISKNEKISFYTVDSNGMTFTIKENSEYVIGR